MSKFKQTEIGLIPEDWEVVRLGEVARLVRGISWRKNEVNKEGKGIPIITIPNIGDGRIDYEFRYFLTKNISPEKLIKLKDIILVGSSGSIENIGRNVLIKYLPFETIGFASFLVVLRTQKVDRLLPEFLSFLVNSKWIDFKRFTKRAADGKFNFQLRDFERNALIPLPPLSEQKKIVKVLDKIQQAIEIQDRIIEQVRNLKKSLMQKLFTEGLYGEEQKETEIGLIPKSWKVVRLGEVCEIVMGQSPPSSTYNNKGIGLPFLQGKAEFGEIYPKPVRYCSKPLKIANRGEILISVRAPVGDVNIAPFKCAIGRGLASIKPVNVENLFLFYFLIFAKRRIENEGTGSTFKAIRKHNLESFLIPLPPLEEQKQIAHILSVVDKKIEVEKRRKQVLKELFKTMLHKLMSGEIRLKEVEI